MVMECIGEKELTKQHLTSKRDIWSKPQENCMHACMGVRRSREFKWPSRENGNLGVAMELICCRSEEKKNQIWGWDSDQKIIWPKLACSTRTSPNIADKVHIWAADSILNEIFRHCQQSTSAGISKSLLICCKSLSKFFNF